MGKDVSLTQRVLWRVCRRSLPAPDPTRAGLARTRFNPPTDWGLAIHNNHTHTFTHACAQTLFPHLSKLFTPLYTYTTTHSHTQLARKHARTHIERYHVRTVVKVAHTGRPRGVDRCVGVPVVAHRCGRVSHMLLCGHGAQIRFNFDSNLFHFHVVYLFALQNCRGCRALFSLLRLLPATTTPITILLP